MSLFWPHRQGHSAEAGGFLNVSIMLTGILPQGLSRDTLEEGVEDDE